MQIRPVGAYALLLDCADQDEVQAWHAELRRRRAAGELHADEIVPAAATILLDGVPDPVDTAQTIQGWMPGPADAATTGPEIEIPVSYDGPDLPLVAGHWNMTVPEVVEQLRTTGFRVAFCGFAPGFGYLTGLPDRLAVPRLATPRPRVPAGSVALAGAYAGIYPGASPGGWLLVGRTDAVLFDVDREPPARLTPGALVRLVDA